MKNMIRIFMVGFLVSLFGFSGVLFGQMRDFQMEVDYATFRYDSESKLLELYYAFHQNQMRYIQQEDSVYRCLVSMNLRIFQNDSLISERVWKSQNSIQSIEEAAYGKDFVDRVKILLEPGSYRGILTAVDEYYPESVDSVLFPLIIETVPENTVSLSDIELAFRIQRNAQDNTNPFYKNTMFVLPNPSRVFGGDNKFLYFYCELYNLHTLDDSTFILSYHIKNNDGRIVDDIKPVSREKKILNESSVEIGALKVGEFKTGSYSLHLSVEDHNEKTLTEKTARFFIYNKEKIGGTEEAYITEEQAFTMSEFPALSEEQLNDDFNKAQYISKKDERAQFKKIEDLDEKRMWLFYFWRSRDLNRDTPQNEFRKQYMQRIQEASDRFRMFGRAGWKTDRGRVFIKLGEPDYINTSSNEENKKPYEIWSYDEIQGGVKFYFADLNETREFRLIHSTMRGEIQNYEWEKIIKVFR